MKCIVVDDNKMARTAIKKLIAQMDFLELIKECSSSVDAFQYLRSNSVDLVFLDVEMPDMTGIELLRNLDKRPIVILVTAKRHYAVEAYELDVADYIVKPVSMSRFAKAVCEARELWEKKQEEEAREKNEYIFIRANSILTKVKATGIIYMEEHAGQVTIQTADNTHTVNTTLNSFEEVLPKNKFYRLHEDYLVAIDRIESVEENRVQVGCHKLPVSEVFRPGLLARLNMVQDSQTLGPIVLQG